MAQVIKISIVKLIRNGLNLVQNEIQQRIEWERQLAITGQNYTLPPQHGKRIIDSLD